MSSVTGSGVAPQDADAVAADARGHGRACLTAAPRPRHPGDPAAGKTHLSIALGIRACLAGHRVACRTATKWVALLADAQRHGHLDSELDRLRRIALLIVDEVGYTV